jgi:hypothetical protein
LGTMTPFAVFAADTAPEYAFRETFSSGSINTSGKSADIDTSSVIKAHDFLETDSLTLK